MKRDSENPKSSGTVLLIDAGAKAAAQGLVRRALPKQLLPFAGAAALTMRLLRRKDGTEIRPAAGNSPTSSRNQPNAAGVASRRVGATLNRKEAVS